MKVIYHRPQTFVDKCRIQHSTALIINKEPSRSLKAQVCCKKIASLIQGQCSCSRRTNKHFGALFFSRQSTHKMQFRQWLYLLQKLEKQLYCELVPLCPIILESTCEPKVNISNELWLNLALTNCGCKVLNWTDKYENQFWYSLAPINDTRRIKSKSQRVRAVSPWTQWCPESRGWVTPGR